MNIPSIRNPIELAITRLQMVNIATPGYTADMDAEVWDFVDWESAKRALDNLDLAIMAAQQAHHRIAAKAVEFSIRNE